MHMCVYVCAYTHTYTHTHVYIHMSFLVFHSSFISNKDLLKVQKSYKNKVGKFIHNDRIGYVTWCAPRHPREGVLEPESPQ